RDYILTPTDLFFRIPVYDSLFRMKMAFNFSGLKIYLPLNKDFPAYQKLARKLTHQEFMASSALKKDLLRLPYKRVLFGGGVADWAITASPIGGGGHYGSLSLGGMALGGDLTMDGTANSMTGFQADQFRYRWHYYFNNNEYITQVEAGNINTTGYFGRSLKGALITNKPQVERRYFQSLNISGHLQEGWEVELYINDRLTDFAYTDQNGDYNFLIDIIYGSSRIVLKMYGPNGELQTEERFVSVPFNLIPRNNIEYSLAAGNSRTQLNNRKYAQGSVYYGVLNSLTIGFSSEASLTQEDKEKPSIAGEATFHPMGNLTLSSNYLPHASLGFAFNFNQPSIIGINGNYITYSENPVRNRLGQINKMMLSISSPLKIGRNHLGLRCHLSIDKYPTYTFINMNYGFSSSFYRFYINYMGNYKIGKYQTRTDREITSQCIFSTSFVNFIRPQFRVNYNHRRKELSAYGVYLTKRVFKINQISVSFERNMVTKSNLVMISFNMFTDFADFSTKSYTTEGQTVVSEIQRGSIRYDQETTSIRFDRKNGLGFGSAVARPFLDANYNGILDRGEQSLPDLRVRVGGSYGIKSGRQKLYYYDGLRPYDEYTVTIDPYSLDNPQLRPAHESFSVTVNPNTVTEIAIPVVTAGEITGKVDRRIPDGKVGVGGIKVVVVNEGTGKETEITTFNNGEYYFLGLVPGMYKASPRTEQLSKYGYACDPPSISFQVKTVEGGDYIENVNFLIVPKQ
ncbi:MAG: hypothetical protein NTV06_10015, partial [candidate division Zixibacteria bacterium]|nr:hypothetical protein [candidate division Zixibacteria bacterium]